MKNLIDSMSVTQTDTVAENAALSYLMSLRSKNSRQKMQYYLRIIANILNSNDDILLCPWHKLTSSHVRAVIDHLLNAGKSPNTVNCYLSLMKGVARFAWILGQMHINAYSHIKDIKCHKGSRVFKGRPLGQQEVKNLFKTCKLKDDSIAVRDTAIVTLLVGCGLRRAELVNLRISDISWEDNSILVLGKGDKERKCFIPDFALNQLKEWIFEVRGDHDGYIFNRIRKNNEIGNTPLTTQAVYFILGKRAKESGISKFTPHDLRRTYANSLLDNGVNLMVIKDMMGHASIQTTQRYLQAKDVRMKEASCLLNNLAS